MAKITTIIIFESKKEVVRLKHRNKKGAKNVMLWFEEKTYQRWKKTLFKCILQSISKNETFQRIAKFFMVKFYEMDLMKGIVI